MRKAIFLDKDGTLIEDIPYSVDVDRIAFKADAIESLRILHAWNFLLIIVTNQSGIARGIFDEADLEAVRIKIKSILFQQNIPLSGFYYCPHHPSGKIEKYRVNCSCRKPKSGMIISAAHDLAIDVSMSWMIGDSLSDIEAGAEAGCKTILIQKDSSDFIPKRNSKVDFIAPDLTTAVKIIELNSEAVK